MNELLSEKQVLEILGICRETLRCWRKQNPPKLTARRIGTRHLRYRRRDVEKLIERLPAAR